MGRQKTRTSRENEPAASEATAKTPTEKKQVDVSRFSWVLQARVNSLGLRLLKDSWGAGAPTPASASPTPPPHFTKKKLCRGGWVCVCHILDDDCASQIRRCV